MISTFAYRNISVNACIGINLKNKRIGGSVTNVWSNVANDRVDADISDAEYWLSPMCYHNLKWYSENTICIVLYLFLDI